MSGNPLHKICYRFKSTQREAVLAARLDGQLTGVANSVKNRCLDPGDTIEATSDLTQQPGEWWEWYCKLTAETSKRGVYQKDDKHADAVNCRTAIADEIRKALDHPTVSDIMEID